MTSVAALELTDWRREVGRLYEQVRADDDPRRAHALWRAGRDRLFATHPQSPLPDGDPLCASGLPYWPYDPALRFELRLEQVTQPRRLAVDTGRDGVTNLEQIGRVTLPPPLRGELGVWWLPHYGGGLFLPVRDGTAGTTTYGGGRYLLDTVKGADLGGTFDTLVVDLNFLYHPSCRYDSSWVCPLAPSENRIDAAVPVGERLPAI